MPFDILDIVYIPYEKLRVDKRNQYSTNGIDELAEAIADVGLQQPLNVAQADDGMYDILGGQRRYLAIGQLLKSGNTKYSEVPCSIANPKNIDLPVDDETKYLYIIATTNEYRDLHRPWTHVSAFCDEVPAPFSYSFGSTGFVNFVIHFRGSLLHR